jgi:lipopolysaccharide transport system ATP-binding protein
MNDTVIRVENLSKQYRIGGERKGYKTLRDSLTEAFVSPFRRARRLVAGQPYGAAELDVTIWALKEVSFEIKRGEVMGIIGRNGAGKTTLLKILSRITEPTEGYAEIRGRVGSLLEVGTGFHPELTGRENMYLNGAILGMRKAEIERKFDEIVDFAEIEKFIDTPVKHYSSGMYVRLAFAVAAHLEPEILLVDEVLAVGDAAFQNKCLGKMKDVAAEGRTVLFVSHNMAAVSALCPTSILLREGSIHDLGQTGDVIRMYLSSMRDSPVQSVEERSDRGGNGSVRVKDVWIEDSKGQPRASIACGDQVSIMISYRGNQPYRSLRFLIGVYDEHNQRVLAFDSETSSVDLAQWPSVGMARCEIVPPLPLSPGRYRINLAIYAIATLADHLVSALIFNVVEGDFFGTGKLPDQIWPMFLVANEWSVE